MYLISSDEVDGDADVGDVDKPEGFVETEAGEEVSGSVVAERGVANAAAHDIEHGGCGHSDGRRFLHHLVFRRV